MNKGWEICPQNMGTLIIGALINTFESHGPLHPHSFCPGHGPQLRAQPPCLTPQPHRGGSLLRSPPWMRQREEPAARAKGKPQSDLSSSQNTATAQVGTSDKKAGVDCQAGAAPVPGTGAHQKVCTYTRAHMYVYTNTYMHAYMQARVQTLTCVHMRVHACKYKCTCSRAHMYTHAHANAHTRTRTHV